MSNIFTLVIVNIDFKISKLEICIAIKQQNCHELPHSQHSLYDHSKLIVKLQFLPKRNFRLYTKMFGQMKKAETKNNHST